MSRKDGNKKLNSENGKKFLTFYDDLQPAWVRRFLEGEAETDSTLAELYRRGQAWKRPPNNLKLHYSKVEKKKNKKPPRNNRNRGKGRK